MGWDDREDELSDLISVCYSHYIYDETQSQIAEKMGVSRAKVCKMIAKAKSRGLFTIQINDPLKHVRGLSDRLAEKYGLRMVKVVPVPKYGAISVLERLGRAAAEVFTSLLRNEDIIGVSGGSALYEMLLKMDEVPVDNTTIVPLLGGYAETETSTRGTEIAYRIAEKLRARIINMPVPGLARDSEEAAIFCANPIVKKSMEWMRKCTIAVFGIGTVDHEGSLYKGGFLNDLLVDELAEENAAGCICFSCYDINGAPCERFNSKIIGMSLKDIVHIPLTIGVAGGSQNKTDAILGAIRGGYLNVLVTDQVTAEHLLEHE